MSQQSWSLARRAQQRSRRDHLLLSRVSYDVDMIPHHLAVEASLKPIRMHEGTKVSMHFTMNDTLLLGPIEFHP